MTARTRKSRAQPDEAKEPGGRFIPLSPGVFLDRRSGLIVIL